MQPRTRGNGGALRRDERRRLSTALSNGREQPTPRRARPKDAHTPEGGRHRRSPPMGGSACSVPAHANSHPTSVESVPFPASGSTKGCGRERNGHHRNSRTPPLVPLQGCWPRGLPGHRGGFDPYMGPCHPPLGRGASKAARATCGRPPHRGGNKTNKQKQINKLNNHIYFKK